MRVKPLVATLTAGIAAAAAMSAAFAADASCIAPLTYVELDGETVGFWRIRPELLRAALGD